MKLIADSGSTKVDWAVVTDSGEIVKHIYTKGINALILPSEVINERIATELAPELSDFDLESIHYYGAGIIGEATRNKIRYAVSASVNCPDIEVQTDLVGAARALCGHRPGIACILGTGSNSALWDGEKVVDNVPAMGYILGDEGSGAVLGKLLIGDLLKRRLPTELWTEFCETTGLTKESVITKVYSEPAPNRFLATLAPFVRDHTHIPQVRQLALNSFKAFFERNISNYPDYTTTPINFVGSIAHYFRDLVAEAAEATDCRIGTIVKAPLQLLIDYHTK